MIRKALGTIIGGILALALVGFVPGARGSERDQSTKFTFSQPVQLPRNMVLPSGSYWFEVPDAVNAGQTVEVFSSDHMRLLGTFETITTERPQHMTQNAQLKLGRIRPSIRWRGTKLGTLRRESPMLISWIYPGQTQGHEFVYSPQKESRLSESGKVATVQIANGATVKVGW